MDITVKQKDAVNLVIECDSMFLIINIHQHIRKKYGTDKFVCLMSTVEHYTLVY